ncbi:MAG: NAD-glutamate dehydrogenase [Pararhizobium sp.]
MTVRRDPKRDRLVRKVREIASSSGEPFVDPHILFDQASEDDIKRAAPETLAASAIHARRELDAFDHRRERVTIGTVAGIEGNGEPLSVLTITDRNMPFLFDSTMAAVTAATRDIRLAIHPILLVRPGAEPELYTADKASDPAERISQIQIHLPLQSRAASEALVRRLHAVLKQVHAAVSDWKAMLEALDSAVEEIKAHAPGRRASDRAEAAAFLDWLRDDNFTFLGMRDYTYTSDGGKGRVEREAGSGLGILADPDVRVLRRGKDHLTTTPEILAFLEGPDLLIVTKANERSLVHRTAYMDYIGIKRFDAAGNVTGELRIVGLFTSTAYTRSLHDIPLLRAKADKVVSRFGFDPQSHSGKMLINTLESYPRDELFQIDASLLAVFCEQINELAERPRVRVLPRIDHFDRFVSVMLYVPRDEYDSDVRERVGAYLARAFDGHVSAYYPAFPESGVVRVHFIIGRAGGKTPRVPQETLEAAVREIVTRWEDRYAAAAPAEGPKLLVTDAYREQFAPEAAVADLADIAAAAEGPVARIAFYRRPHEAPHELSLKIFNPGAPVALSKRVPLLENLGFSVISEQTFEIEVMRDGAEPKLVVLHDMELAEADGRPIDLDPLKARLEEAYLAIWTGEIDNDSFNRLVIEAGLDARETMVLRAYARYLRQTGIIYSQGYIAGTLDRYPAIAADIFRLFHNRFDPSIDAKTREKRAAMIGERIEEALADVPSLDDDRILRRTVNAVEASLRTNYFQKAADGDAQRQAFAFKLDPRQLEGLPAPRPYREIFVYGADVEGVHLRFGPVARGGLRWSDRAEDYRTEVLGLVKAQQVKNAVIVPVGAKGGFYPKALPSGGAREEVFNAGREAYKTYVSTLLSVTDNIEGDHAVPPAETVRHDGDDPYFVVAADKGTATFSDTANAISQAHHFWLDDAFASGGSDGYDHKKMGITARGAWEAVKRHFREMDVDIQTTPFTVAGVGDMSGDVFGNGMLLSEQTRLIAAFDHRDIFIDPDPDAARSFAERKRLFALARSSWQDYDKAQLSKGGLIVSRSQKSVTLSPEAAAAIGLDRTKATPPEIMSAILKAPVDLLWFGGIGTYVKGDFEADATVGDRANDAIRVAASDVRAKVIGEGANLGVTQRGRIAYAQAGGRCNSDAIDNSAGVNCSDVEVNIKIALASAMREGRLTRGKRNKLLAAMTDEVADLVLVNNYLQTLAISLTERLGVKNGDELSGLMTFLETHGHLDRKLELLPDDQTMSERYAAGKPLTRPEIGVLLSYAKIVLFGEITESSLPDDPYLEPTLTSYFPEKMRKAHRRDIENHRLRREIIATTLANDAINRGRPGFVVDLSTATGALPSDVVRAYVMVRDGLDLPALYAAIDALDAKVPGALQNDLYATVTAVIRFATGWALKSGAYKAELTATVSALRGAIAALRPNLPGLMPDFLVHEAEERRAALMANGVPEDLAETIAALHGIAFVPEIMQIAGQTKTSLKHAASAFFAVTDIFRIARMTDAAYRITTGDRFEALALARSLDEISAARRAITAVALTHYAKSKDPVGKWIEAESTRVGRSRAQISALTEAGDITVAKMTVAAGMLGDLARLETSG